MNDRRFDAFKSILGIREGFIYWRPFTAMTISLFVSWAPACHAYGLYVLLTNCALTFLLPILYLQKRKSAGFMEFIIVMPAAIGLSAVYVPLLKSSLILHLPPYIPVIMYIFALYFAGSIALFVTWYFTAHAGLASGSKTLFYSFILSGVFLLGLTDHLLRMTIPGLPAQEAEYLFIRPLLFIAVFACCDRLLNIYHCEIKPQSIKTVRGTSAHGVAGMRCGSGAVKGAEAGGKMTGPVTGSILLLLMALFTYTACISMNPYRREAIIVMPGIILALLYLVMALSCLTKRIRYTYYFIMLTVAVYILYSIEELSVSCFTLAGETCKIYSITSPYIAEGAAEINCMLGILFLILTAARNVDFGYAGKPDFFTYIFFVKKIEPEPKTKIRRYKSS